MKTARRLRIASLVFISAAVTLVAYGLFGLSHFDHYAGEYFDERMVIFDNGVYPFMWGVVLLLIGQLARLRYQRPAMLTAASAAIAVFAWQRTTVPAAVAGQSVFPDAALLTELLVIAGALLVLALADVAMAAGIRRIARGPSTGQG